MNIETSEYNRLPEAIQESTFPPRVRIIDSTIRSLQSTVSGSTHKAQDLVEIGKALDHLGVDEICVSLTWRDGLAVCEGLAAQGLQAKIVGTVRARSSAAVGLAAAGEHAGASEINFESIPDVDYMVRAAQLIHSQDKTISCAFTEHCAYPEVVSLASQSAACGYESISFHDTFFKFAITPEGARSLFRSLRRDVPGCPPLYIHLSNFFGLALASSLAVLSAGATGIDVSMNGIGHNCGHVSLAQAVTALEGLYGVRTGIRLAELNSVSLLVRERSGIPMRPDEPVNGDWAFAIDGANWAGEAHLPYDRRLRGKPPYPASLVGGSEEPVVWSDRTITDEAVRARLQALALRHAADDVRQIKLALASALERKPFPNWLTDAEFASLCRGIARDNRPEPPK